MQLLKRILTAVVLIPIVLLLILRAPVPVLALVAALVALLATQELLKLAEAYGIRPFHWATYIFIGLFFIFLAVPPGDNKPLLSSAIFIYTAGFAAAIAPFVFLTIGMRRADLSTSFQSALVSSFRLRLRGFALGIPGADSRTVVGRFPASLPASARLGRRHFCLFRRPFAGTSPDVAADQSKEDLGRGYRFPFG